MASKSKKKVEFGDFQTPDSLCERVCDLLLRLNMSPNAVVEPTCGKGSFLRASKNAFPSCKTLLGIEINPEYAKQARAIENTVVHCESFFDRNWPETLDKLEEPILVIGNPPWVTNSKVGALKGSNLPPKSNFEGLT